MLRVNCPGCQETATVAGALSRGEGTTVVRLRALAAVAAPTAIALGALCWFADLAVDAAVLAVGLVTLAHAALLWRYERSLARTLDHALTVSGDVTMSRPAVGGLSGAYAAACARLEGRWKADLASAAAAAGTGLERVLDGVPEPLVVIDRRRRVLRANRAAERLLGGDLVGRDIAGSLRHPAVLDALDRILGGVQHQEVEFSWPGAVERSFAGHVAGLGGAPAETAPAAVIALYDLTAVKRLERLRADFVANASHELRTPLATLLGFIETLQGPAREDREAAERFLPVMRQQAERMARLVSDLLSLSRIELDEHTLPSGRADLRQIIQTVLDALERQAKENDMTFAVELDPGVTMLAGDPDQLLQVLQNLIDNALKYGRRGTTVRIRGRQAAAPGAGQPIIEIAVSDEGGGIAPEHIPRLTERFYRVDTARSRALGGTGLGLAIVKHIVNRHRGTLSISSELGRGSTFTVALPVPGPMENG
ncbi:MAG: PAS domain-containing protein [Alphaproteobacteria bacterium]|nr:PAS domain-containing protein [Alphaproteobacteria bacterium]